MNFDRLAPHYDWMEAITAGRLLQRARTWWLPELAGCQSVLSVGEGHGRFAAAFLAANREAQLTCLEASPKMLARARRRVERTVDAGDRRVRWIQCAVEDWEPDVPGKGSGFDAVVTCFFLDCFPVEPLATIIGKLAGCAAPGALWLNVDFAIPGQRGLPRLRAQAIHAVMYAFFKRAAGLRATRLVSPDPFLTQGGFVRHRHTTLDWGLIRADLWRRPRA